MSATLQAFLRSSCCALGVEPHHLSAPSAMEDPLSALLREAIDLREAQQPALSLQVLELASTAGLSSDWIDDNRARALLALDRREEAEALLLQLGTSDTPEIAEAARSLLTMLEEGLPVGLEVVTDIDNNPECTELLEQAIQLREQGLAQASLELLEHAAAAGHSSPWLDDNRARALVHLERRHEAEAIWSALADHPDLDVASMASAMATQLRAALLEELLQSAEAAAEPVGWSLRFLTIGIPSLEAAQEAVLQEAIACREADQASLSLALVESAQALGFSSPWLQDNRARALVGLGRRQQAMAIWQGLETCDDPVLAAESMLLAGEQAQLLVAELRDRLFWVAANQGLQLEALPEAGETVEALEDATLKDAIAARERGSAEASLALLEAAIDAGLQSGWLQDNRARALVHLDRLPPAVALWRDLLENEDQSLRQAAAEMVEVYGGRADRETTLAQADALLDGQEVQAAIDLLSEAILRDPEWDGWREALKRAVALRSDGGPESEGLLDQELRQPRLALQAFDAFLSAVEQRQGLQIR